MSLKNALIVGCGAALGSMARQGTVLLLGPSFVTITLINICGCFAIGAIKPGPFWTIGFLGGFSSYSTYLVMTYQAESAIYLVSEVIFCLGAWLLGDVVHDHLRRAHEKAEA